MNNFYDNLKNLKTTNYSQQRSGEIKENKSMMFRQNEDIYKTTFFFTYTLNFMFKIEVLKRQSHFNFVTKKVNLCSKPHINYFPFLVSNKYFRMIHTFI